MVCFIRMSSQAYTGYHGDMHACVSYVCLARQTSSHRLARGKDPWRATRVRTFCGMKESKFYGEGLSYGKWKWLPGPECLPELGLTTPRRGLGVFVDYDKLPGVSVVWSGLRSMCVKVPAPAPLTPTFVLFSHPLKR